MRRNTARVLKYLIIAALFLTIGPLMIKTLFGDQHEMRSVVIRQAAVQAHGLPVDPDEMKEVIHKVIFIFNF